MLEVKWDVFRFLREENAEFSLRVGISDFIEYVRVLTCHVSNYQVGELNLSIYSFKDTF
jgi:hypothetical protein